MFAGASLDENSGAFCELKANFFRLILTKAELLALTSADFDFDKETVTINKSYQRLHGEDVITTPKTKKSNRTIKMPHFLCEEMQEYLGMLYGLKKKDRIFTVTKSYLHHEMDRGAKAAGVKRIRIHDLRHSHIRVSPEENERINKAVALSGLPKQEYCYRRCLNQDVVVQGNPRVYKALKQELAAVLAELQRIEAGNGVNDELLDVIELISVILGGLKGEEQNE